MQATVQLLGALGYLFEIAWTEKIEGVMCLRLFVVVRQCLTARSVYVAVCVKPVIYRIYVGTGAWVYST